MILNRVIRRMIAWMIDALNDANGCQILRAPK